MYTSRSSAVADYDVCVKSIIVGDSGVGKSSLLYRYTDQDWNPHYIATIGVDFKVLTFERNNKVVKLQLWDTAGQERFRTITHSYYRGAHAVMLVFSVTDRESFDNVKRWVGDVRKYGSETVPMVLVGNKSDVPESQRVVPDEEAEALAESLGCKYVKASAKENMNVDVSFGELVDDCVAERLKKIETGRKNPVLLPARDGKKREHSGPCEC